MPRWTSPAWEHYERTKDFAALMKSYDGFLTLQKSKMRRMFAPGMKDGVGTVDELDAEVEYGFMQAVNGFDPDKGSLPAYAVLRIRNAVQEFVRKLNVPEFVRKRGQRKQSIHPSEDDDGIDIVARLDCGKLDLDIWKRIYDVLESRPSRYYLFVNLQHREGWSRAEIAHYFDITESSVSLTMAKAMAILARSHTIRRVVNGTWRRKRIPPAKRRYGEAFNIPKQSHCCIVGCMCVVDRRGKCLKHYRKPKAVRCIADGCDRPVNCRGLCKMHYDQPRLKRRYLPVTTCEGTTG